MPELPEVEITRRGIAPLLEGRAVTGVTLRHTGLRWPFPENISGILKGKTIQSVERRSKYLLLTFTHGTLLIHLGMSGRLRILPANIAPNTHDHFDLELGKQVLRLTDPRRFGAVLWHPTENGPIADHPLFQKLGLEPFDPAFSGAYLYEKCRNRRSSIKQVLLSGHIVVGVGNIYTSESLFLAGINPKTPANRISRQRYDRLTEAIQTVLNTALEQGGTTLRDFTHPDGQAGYFQMNNAVYGRTGEPCRQCGQPIKQIRQGQRSTFYCPHCQT